MFQAQKYCQFPGYLLNILNTLAGRGVAFWGITNSCGCDYSTCVPLFPVSTPGEYIPSLLCSQMEPCDWVLANECEQHGPCAGLAYKNLLMIQRGTQMDRELKCKTFMYIKAEATVTT